MIWWGNLFLSPWSWSDHALMPPSSAGGQAHLVGPSLKTNGPEWVPEGTVGCPRFAVWFHQSLGNGLESQKASTGTRPSSAG